MAIKIGVVREQDGPPSSSLGAVLSNMLFPKRGVGRPAPEVWLLQGESPRLLYFRTKGCTVCDLIDMRVAQGCARAGVTLNIVDRWPKEGRPAQATPYLDEAENLVDADGSVNAAFGVAVYPTFVLIGQGGRILWREVGAQAKDDVFDQHLTDQFRAKLMPAT